MDPEVGQKKKKKSNEVSKSALEQEFNLPDLHTDKWYTVGKVNISSLWIRMLFFRIVGYVFFYSALNSTPLFIQN